MEDSIIAAIKPSSRPLVHSPVAGTSRPNGRSSSLGLIKKIEHINRPYRDRQATQRLRSVGYYEHKTLSREFLSAVKKGVVLEAVDNGNTALGNKGRQNSKTTANALSVMRSLEIKLEDHGLDGHIKKIIKPKLKSNLSTQTKLLSFNHSKDTAKTVSNLLKFNQLNVNEAVLSNKLDKIVNQSTSPKINDIAMTCGSLIEYSSGVAVSFITLKNLLNQVSKTNNHRKQLEQHLHSFALLFNKKTILIGKLSSQNDAMLRQSLREDINSIDEALNEMAFSLVALSQHIEHAFKKNLCKKFNTHCLKILRYVASTTAIGLVFAAQFAAGGASSVALLHAGFATATGAGGLATILNIDALIDSLKKVDHEHSFKRSLGLGIENIDVKIEASECKLNELNSRLKSVFASIDNKQRLGFIENIDSAPASIRSIIVDLGNTIQELSQHHNNRELALMVLGKQTDNLENSLNVGANILTTGAYIVSTVSAGASIAILAGLGGAMGVFLAASPVGWALGGTGAAIAIGLSIRKAGLYYVHHKKLNKMIKACCGESKIIQINVEQAKKNHKTLGPAHEVLTKQLEGFYAFPAHSSRSGVAILLDRILDELGDVLEGDEFLPDISLIEVNGKADFILNNPLKNIRQYQEAKPKSATIKFILGLFPPNKQAAVNEVVDKAMEAARLGQAEIALQIIAKLMNVTPASNKT